MRIYDVAINGRTTLDQSVSDNFRGNAHDPQVIF